MSVLTNRRLIVVYGNAEESYPLSKITAVKIIFKRSIAMLVIGVLIALGGLGALSSSVLAGLAMLLIGGAMAYFGWKGKTHLGITQMGGEKSYSVRGRDAALDEFMHAVNTKLA